MRATCGHTRPAVLVGLPFRQGRAALIKIYGRVVACIDRFLGPHRHAFLRLLFGGQSAMLVLVAYTLIQVHLALRQRLELAGGVWERTEAARGKLREKLRRVDWKHYSLLQSTRPPY